MLNYFHIEDYLNVMDIEINKVDQQIFVLNKCQPRKKTKIDFYFILVSFWIFTSAISGSSSSSLLLLLSSTNT